VSKIDRDIAASGRPEKEENRRRRVKAGGASNPQNGD
jgi:hypothetical protein